MISETLVLRPHPKMHERLQFSEIWKFRELIYFLCWRDVKVRYRQAALGVAWALFQPLVSVGTFTLIFGKLGKLPSDGIAYPLFVFAAMTPWNLFANAVSKGSNSLLSNSHLLTKVYFPRVIVPLASVISCFMDYLIAFALFVAFGCYLGNYPSLHWLWAFPLLSLCVILSALGISLWLGALNVRYRDIGHVLPFMIQMWLFATPVLYTTNSIPESYRWVASLNPMTGFVNAYRCAFLGMPWPTNEFIMALGLTLIILAGGLFYFSTSEKAFADIV